MPQEKPTKIYVGNSSAIALSKNPVYYLRDCIANKKVEVK
jgi:hypothetical protein